MKALAPVRIQARLVVAREEVGATAYELVYEVLIADWRCNANGCRTTRYRVFREQLARAAANWLVQDWPAATGE